MSRITLIVFFLSIFFAVGPMAAAADTATPDEVFELILKAVPVMEELGEEGLEAFKDPKGEFVYKDTYVYVIDCANLVLAAHPNAKLVGRDIKNDHDKNPDAAKQKIHGKELCEVSNRPNGGWVEYYWEKLGEKTPSRKISFAIKIQGTDYALIAGIYDHSTDVDKLNASLN